MCGYKVRLWFCEKNIQFRKVLNMLLTWNFALWGLLTSGVYCLRHSLVIQPPTIDFGSTFSWHGKQPSVYHWKYHPNSFLVIGGKCDKIFAFLEKPSKCPSSKSFLNLELSWFQKFSKIFLFSQVNMAGSEKNENWKSGQSTIIILNNA